MTKPLRDTIHNVIIVILWAIIFTLLIKIDKLQVQLEQERVRASEVSKQTANFVFSTLQKEKSQTKKSPDSAPSQMVR